MQQELIESLAPAVLAMIRETRGGMVVAIWADLNVTIVGFGFRRRRTAEHAWEEPVSSFPAQAPLTEMDVRLRLLRDFERHGLLPPDPRRFVLGG